MLLDLSFTYLIDLFWLVCFSTVSSLCLFGLSSQIILVLFMIYLKHQFSMCSVFCRFLSVLKKINSQIKSYILQVVSLWSGNQNENIYKCTCIILTLNITLFVVHQFLWISWIVSNHEVKNSTNICYHIPVYM